MGPPNRPSEMGPRPASKLGWASTRPGPPATARKRSMRTLGHRCATFCLVASSLLVSPVTSFAQGKKPAAAAKDKKAAKDDKDKGKDKGKTREINLDEGADTGPVTAGQMTEEAAQGKRLFDAER